jgi:hypothetical protein
VPNTVHILRVERDILCECLVERLSSIVPFEFSAGDGGFWKKGIKNNRRSDLVKGTIHPTLSLSKDLHGERGHLRSLGWQFNPICSEILFFSI